MISCNNDENSKVMTNHQISYPIPFENPVYFTPEAQTKNIHVLNMVMVWPENPETEIVEYNNTITQTQGLWIIIANDWLTVKYGNDVPKNTVEITVKENTAGERRYYNLELPSEFGKYVLAIVQE